MVQMPCPEQLAWGGVTKRFLMAACGTKETLQYRFRRILLPLAVAYTRFVYRRIARQKANQIDDYLSSGYSVIGIVGVDGSPSCGSGRRWTSNGRWTRS
jgi:predicted secreted protein